MSKISSIQEAGSYFVGQGNRGNISEQTKADFTAGRIQLKDAVKFIRKEITVGSRVELVDSTTIQKAGVTNFVGNKLDDRNNLIIAAISLGYASNAASGKEASGDYITTPIVALRNAELEITQNGKKVVSLPVSDCINQGSGTSQADNYRVLGALAFLEEGKDFKIDLVFAAGAVAGAAHDYVEVALRGFESVAR